MEWISVEDRLPTEELKASGIRVLKNGIEHCAYWNHDAQKWCVGGWECCHYCGGTSVVTFFKNSLYPKTIISHWMPLPNPPKD